MVEGLIEAPALIGLKDSGAGVVNRHVTQAHQCGEQAKVLDELKKQPRSTFGGRPRLSRFQL